MPEENLSEDRMIKATPRQLRDWFILRFGRMPEHDKRYYADWQERFKRWSGWAYMDLESRKKWLKVEDAYSKKKKLKEVV